MYRRAGLRALVMLTLAGLACGRRAAAAEALHDFRVPEQPLAAALVQLAVQADVSIGTRQASQCAPRSRAVNGRLTLQAALTRLMDGTGCTFRLIDAGAVEVVPARPLAPRPAPPPHRAPDAALATSPTAMLDELVVVATRRPTRSDGLAYPVSSLDGASLAQLGAHDIGDLATATPAMTVTNLGLGRDKILIRGLSDGPLTGRTQSMVGLYLDDVRLTYNAPDPDLRLVDVVRVEVLRGPQGALYGSGSLGGVIQLITAPPRADGFAGWVAASGGVTRAGGGSGALEGMVNLPLPGGRGAVRLVGYRELQGGYIGDPALGLQDANRSQRFGGRAAVAMPLSDRWTATAGLVGQGINSDDTQYSLMGGPIYARRNQVREPHDNDFAEAHFGLQGDLPKFDVKWTTALVRHRLASRYDASAAPPVPTPLGPTPLGPTPLGPVAFDDEDVIASLVSEATLASKSSSGPQWLAGAFLSRSRQDVSLSVTSLSATPVRAFQETRRDHLDEAALFGEVVLPWSSQLSLTVGGRAFLSDADARSGPGNAQTGPAPFSGQVSRAGFAPKVVLAYRRSATLLLYVQAAEGYRAGGINTGGPLGQTFSPEGGMQPNRLYRGDELWSFEMGGRVSALDGRLTIRSALFQSIWRNIQSDQLLASGLPFTANIGDGRNTGLELEGRYVDGRLIVLGNLLLNAPELSRANSAFPARRDLGLAGVPGISTGLSAHYWWPVLGSRRLEFDARYAYVGSSNLTFDAITSPRMGGYANGRIAASLASEAWRLTAAIENPADAHGNTFAYGNPFTLRTTRQATPLRPITGTIGISVTY